MWIVRYVGADGDLTEARFSGALADLAGQFDEASIRALVRDADPAAGANDAGRGVATLTVERSDADRGD